MMGKIKKILVTLILSVIIINQQFLLLVSEAIEELQTDNISAIAELNMQKYVNYELNENEKGVLVQTSLKTGIEYENNQESKSLKSTEVYLNISKIDNCYPENVKVIAKNTKATNGQDTQKEANYEYNHENGELKIWESNNQNEDGQYYEQKDENAKDEYIIMAYYGTDCYKENEEKTEIKITGKVEETVYDENETKLDKDVNLYGEVTTNINGLVSTNLTSSDIYNGAIFANSQNGAQKETQYSENVELNVSYSELADGLQIDSKNTFINNQNQEIDTQDIIYKSTYVRKQELVDIFGEEGKIEILNESGETIAEISKDSEEKGEGIVEVNYPENLENVIIKTTTPKKAGFINIQHKKEIKSSMIDINNNKIKTTNTISAIKAQEENAEVIYRNINDGIFEIKNSESCVDIKMDTTELTNQVQNEVNIRAILKTNDIKYNLFKNPTIIIAMPSEVEQVILGQTSLLYDDNLSIRNAEVIDVGNQKAIKIEIEGTQNEYKIDSIVEGANIVIPATVILKKEIESINTTIETIYSNESASSIDYINEGKERKSTNIKINSVISIPESEDEVVYVSDPIVKTSESNLKVENSGIEAETIAQVGSKILSEGDNVHENEIIKYSVKIKNTTDSDISNVKLEGNIPEGTTYAYIDYGDGDIDDLYVTDSDISQYSETIEKIEAGKTIERFYEVEVNKLQEDTKEIENIVKIYKDNSQVWTNSLKNTVKKGEMSIRLKSSTTEELNKYEYAIWLYNNEEKDLENLIIRFEMPDEMEYLSYELYEGEAGISVTQSGKNVTIKVDKIDANSEIDILIATEQKGFVDNKYEYNLEAYAEVRYGEDIYYSNQDRLTTYAQGVQIIQTSEQEGKKLKYDEEIEYDFVIKNIGRSEEVEVLPINAVDYLPEELDPVSAEYETFNLNDETEEWEIETEELDLTESDEEEGEENVVNIYATIPEGEEIHIKVKATAGVVGEETEIANEMTVSSEEEGIFSPKTSNTIKCIILPYGYTDEDNAGNNAIPPSNTPNSNNSYYGNDYSGNVQNPNKKYKINGTVWIDKNSDGAKNNDEEKLANVPVKLYNTDTNSIVKNSNGENYTTTTNESGKYEFSNVDAGSYLVLFEYDTDKYTPTSYQKSGVTSTSNSDAIKKDVNIDGQIKTVAVTDVISLNGSNKENIDLGLIQNSTFDFSLEKYVNKITLVDSSANKEYSYGYTKLAKIEIPAKKLGKTTLNIEYQFVVKNEGDVEGYISEITDYLPEGLSFDSSLNSGWTKGNNGNIINTELASTKIKPGETKEVYLTLTKRMTEDSTGTITNSAEISKTISSDNLTDKDSTVNNKNKEEDDYSEAQVIISVKTGILTYTLLIIVTLIVLLIIYKLLKDKKINMKQLMMFCTVIVSLGIICSANISDGYTSAEIKNKLKGKFTWDDDYGKVISSGSEYFATHSSKESVYVTNKEGKHAGRLHCTNGSRAMCGTGSHYYKQYSVKITLVSKKATVNSGNKYSDATDKTNLTRESYKGSDMIGPYKITQTGTNEDSVDSATYKDFNGNTYSAGIYKRIETEIKDSNGNVTGTEITFKDIEDTDIRSGQKFYLKVPSGASVASARIKISSDRTVTYTGKYKVREIWKCYKVSGSGSHKGSNPKHTNDYPCVSASNAQILEKIRKNLDYNFKDETDKYTTVKLPGLSGTTLKVEKVDKDSNAKIENATIRLTRPDGSTEDKDTDENGTVTFTVEEGKTYSVKEVEAPPEYKLSWQDNSDIGKSITIETGENTVTLYDRKYGNLKIKKVDKDSVLPLEGVNFYIIYSDGSKFKNVKDNTEFNFNNYTANQHYSTDENGEIIITKLPTYYKYWIYEYGTENEEIKPYYEFNDGSWNEIELEPIDDDDDDDDYTEYYCENQQRYIDLSGYIWEDKVSGKASTSNDLYYDADGDIDPSKVKGVKIELINSQTGQVVANRYGVVCSTTSVDRTNLKADENLSYRFCSVPMYDSSGNNILDKYYVRFEYNGLRYASVNVKTDQENGSKSKEVSSSRTELNNTFATISNPDDSKEKYNVTTGYSGNTDNEKINKLKYDGSEDYKSTLIEHTNYSPKLDEVNSKYIEIADSSKSKGIGVESNTKEAGYVITRYKDSNVDNSEIEKEITNINLGIKERSQVDLAIKNDISKIKFEMNGYTHIYNYSQRDGYVQKDNQGTLLTEYDSGYNSALDGFLPEVKNSRGYNMSYTREVYKSYVNCNKYATDDTKKLKIYITYEIEVANYSNVTATVNEITDYYDSNKLNTTDSTLRDIVSNYKGTDYAKGTIKGLNLTIDPYKSEKIYLTFQVKDEIIKSLMNGDSVIENVTEINKYTTTDNGKIYGSIDKDSAPGNTIPGNTDTYEDDTDRAPGLTIKTSEIKKIVGTVFEDDISSFNESEKVHENEERLGNGKYGSEDIGKVSNVKVELIDKKTEEQAEIYLDSGLSYAIDITDEDGKYEFEGLIPGEYILKYTYGDGDTTIINYGEFSKVLTTQDYKSTIITSEVLKNVIKGKETDEDKKNYWYLTDEIMENQNSIAYDNYERRKEINKKYESINYNVETNYTSDEINADSPTFKIAIEDHEYGENGSEYGKQFVHEYVNMNFGVVERPKQSIEITKYVSDVKLTLANGQVIVDGDPRTGNLNYVTYPMGGSLKIEIDNEIIQGATLNLRYEISSANRSELDYDNENYYVFAEDKNDDDLVCISIDKIVDYLDEKLVYNTDSTENKWSRIEAKDLKNTDLNDIASGDKNNITSNVYNAIENKNNIFIAENLQKLTEIEPGKEGIVTFDSSKILYNITDELEFDNYTEIIKHSNRVGRFNFDYYKGAEKTTPGNYIPQKDAENNTEETDSNFNYRDITRYNNATTVIVPPTGQIRIYFAIGFSCLVILAVGIVIIKKKVL